MAKIYEDAIKQECISLHNDNSLKEVNLKKNHKFY